MRLNYGRDIRQHTAPFLVDVVKAFDRRLVHPCQVSLFPCRREVVIVAHPYEVRVFVGRNVLLCLLEEVLLPFDVAGAGKSVDVAVEPQDHLVAHFERQFFQFRAVSVYHRGCFELLKISNIFPFNVTA